MAVGKGSIKAKVIRLTRLDAGGNPVAGTCSVIVSSGFTRVQASAEYEDGEEFTVKNAWGDFCINEKDADRLKRMNLTIDFCAVHPDVADMIAGATPLEDGSSNVVGFAVTEDVSTSKFMLELWSAVAGDATSWHYWVFPEVDVGRIGDLTFEYGPLTFTVEAPTKPVDGWSYPFSPAPYTGTLPDGTHYFYVQTAVDPPPATAGCVDYPLAGLVATEAFAGAPGYFGPIGAAAPADVAALTTLGITATPGTAWTTGQYVQTATAGASGQAYWDGDSWEQGIAP